MGGKLGTVFDEEPRRWRMVAEFVTSTGMSMELATAFFPQQFLLLASMGNFAKALGRGMGVPSFRVIQQHFSRTNNVGEVAAKEEVSSLIICTSCALFSDTLDLYSSKYLVHFHLELVC